MSVRMGTDVWLWETDEVMVLDRPRIGDGLVSISLNRSGTVSNVHFSGTAAEKFKQAMREFVANETKVSEVAVNAQTEAQGE